MKPGAKYQVLVVGAGHAGIEAALAAARCGSKVALITINKRTIGRMACNPSIGGLAKGQMVRELDALGGVMGSDADFSGIQFKILNRTKGRAVWSHRAQVDKLIYEAYENDRRIQSKGIDVVEAQVSYSVITDCKIGGVMIVVRY